MKITIYTIDHKNQRYPTLGDWEFHDYHKDDIVSPGQDLDEVHLMIRVSDLADPKENFLLVIHELVEAILCKFSIPEVTQEQVDAFDMSNPQLEDPGADPTAPYHKQHMAAEIIEFRLATYLGVDWHEYDKKVKSFGETNETKNQ